MPVGLQLDAVETGGLHAFGGGRVGGDDALDVPVLGRLREGAVRRLAHRRGCEHRQPVGRVPAGAPAQVGDLDHHRGARLVAVVGEAPQPGHDLVLVGVQVAEGRRRVLGDDGRAGGHGERDAALGLLDVVEAVAVLGQAVLGVRRLVRGRHDAVAQRQVPELEGLQERVGGGHGERDVRCVGGRQLAPPAASAVQRCTSSSAVNRSRWPPPPFL